MGLGEKKLQRRNTIYKTGTVAIVTGEEET